MCQFDEFFNFKIVAVVDLFEKKMAGNLNCLDIIFVTCEIGGKIKNLQFVGKF